jgi:hypothetical protein
LKDQFPSYAILSLVHFSFLGRGNLYLKFFLALLMGILPRSDIGMGFAASVRGSEVMVLGREN